MARWFVGPIFILMGAGFFLVRERFLASVNDSNARLFGRFAPAARWPKVARAWNLGIVVITAVTMTVVGVLILAGVIQLDG